MRYDSALGRSHPNDIRIGTAKNKRAAPRRPETAILHGMSKAMPSPACSGLALLGERQRGLEPVRVRKSDVEFDLGDSAIGVHDGQPEADVGPIGARFILSPEGFGQARQVGREEPLGRVADHQRDPILGTLGVDPDAATRGGVLQRVLEEVP
jgi:hypothetical protein